MGSRRSEITDQRTFQIPSEGDELFEQEFNLLEHCSEDEVELIQELNN